MNPGPMTTAERELTDAECDAIADGFSVIADGYREYDRALIRAGWQARAGAPPVVSSEAEWLDYKEAARQTERSVSRLNRELAARDAAPSPPGPSDEANQGAQPVAFKERLSEILMAAINKNDRYTFDGGHYIRWGAVERDILAAYAFRAPDTQVAPSPPPHELDALLPEICMLIDGFRGHAMAEGSWSEWDQSVRDRLTAYNLRRIGRCPTGG